MTKFKVVCISFGVLVAAILLLAATRPGRFRVERTTSIKAPPEKIFPLINEFRRWSSWSPYEKLDPAMKRAYSGATDGKGAVYEWDSQGNAGAGRMEITEVSQPSKVTINLDFLRPFTAHNIAEFTLDSQGDSTNVTWAMHFPNPYIAKLMSLFISMDRMVGKDFEVGLANLKAITEK